MENNQSYAIFHGILSSLYYIPWNIINFLLYSMEYNLSNAIFHGILSTFYYIPWNILYPMLYSMEYYKFYTIFHGILTIFYYIPRRGKINHSGVTSEMSTSDFQIILVDGSPYQANML